MSSDLRQRVALLQGDVREKPSRDELFELYWRKGLTPSEIGTRYSTTKNTVLTWMRRLDVPRRSKSEAMKLLFEQGSVKKRHCNVPVHGLLVCRQCGADWNHDNGGLKANCPFCGKEKDARDRGGMGAGDKERLKLLQENPKRGEYAKAHRVLQRKRVLFKVSGSIAPVCVRCGCDDTRLLEINHKNGGGGREMKAKGVEFYRSIISGERPTDDLEILCRPCNAVHALELKHGPLAFRVHWGASK